MKIVAVSLLKSVCTPQISFKWDKKKRHFRYWPASVFARGRDLGESPSTQPSPRHGHRLQAKVTSMAPFLKVKGHVLIEKTTTTTYTDF